MTETRNQGVPPSVAQANTRFRKYPPFPGFLLPQIPDSIPLRSNKYLYTLGGVMKV